LALAREVLEIEAAAVAALASRLDERFVEAVRMILECRGRVVVTGIGKSGQIGRKIASTLASTGTPAFFVHPGEASHGDLGMITRDDVAIAISYSGESDELMTILPLVKRLGAGLVALTGDTQSSLAKLADVVLDAAVEKEACPLNLAPTASTTAALALGDALAVALLDARGFGHDDFARSHPGGALGRRLLTHVRDVMRTGEDVPAVAEGAALAEAVERVEILDLLAIVGERQHAVGEDAIDVEGHQPKRPGPLDRLAHRTFARKRSWMLSAPTSWPPASTTGSWVVLYFSITSTASAASASGRIERGLRVITAATGVA